MGTYFEPKYLKGVWYEIFSFFFLSHISFPLCPEYPIGAISHFYENSRMYSNVKVNHWCQQHREKVWVVVYLYRMIFNISRYRQTDTRTTVLSLAINYCQCRYYLQLIIAGVVVTTNKWITGLMESMKIRDNAELLVSMKTLAIIYRL